MKLDYSSVASRYDLNPVRTHFSADTEITGSTRKVLDVGCGTGNYLAHQIVEHDSEVHWHGIDANEAMLRIARTKVPRALFSQGLAECLPYPDCLFDYVVCNFAFHHFTDKGASLAEMRRILSDGGRIKLTNIVPELSRSWWIYRYFPSAASIDARRFWTLDQVGSLLKRLGFSTDIETEATDYASCDSILAEARNRETSQLVLITDEEYVTGMSRLELDCAGGGNETMEYGLVTCKLVARLATPSATRGAL